MTPKSSPASTRAPPAPPCCCWTERQQVVGRGYREIPQHFPQPGWVEHDPEDHWRIDPGGAGRGPAQAGDPPDRGGGHHQPARDHRAVGSAQRHAGGPGHRLAGPAHPGRLRRAAGGRSRAGGAGPDRTGHRPLFLGDQDRLAAGSPPGLRDRAERGEMAFGTVDSWLAYRLSGGKAHITDASNASRTLLYDLHTLRLQRRAVPDCSGCPGRCCPGWCGSSGQLARVSGVPGHRGRHAAGRDRRRPAGGAVRAGLLAARGRQVHLRHRRLPAGQHRRSADHLAPAPADQRGLAAGRAHHVRPGGQRLRGRGAGAVAARRPGHDRQGRRHRGPGPAACPTAAGWSSCRRCPGWARPTGGPRRAG